MTQNLTLMSNEEYDLEDLKTLFKVIVRQAIDDYVKLMHPCWRKKKELKDAFITATEFIFDDTYRSRVLKNDDNSMADFQFLANFISSMGRADLEVIRKNVIEEAVNHWMTIPIKTLDIPETISFRGRTWIFAHKETEPQVHWPDRLVTMNMSNTTVNERNFIRVCHQILCLENDITYNEDLADAWFELLKMNNAFVGND